MYIVTATKNGRQIPTFFIDENIQGVLTDNGITCLAHEILCDGLTGHGFPWTCRNPQNIHVHVEKMGNSEIMQLGDTNKCDKCGEFHMTCN